MSANLQPFHEIALCLSGGGYRAAGFHLGSMSYLNRIRLKADRLLHRVKAISTVSGGTIIGAYYTLCDAQGKSFNEFYKEFRDFLENHDLIKESLERLGGKEQWRYDEKSRNLINAFSEIYDGLLTKGARMADVSGSELGHIDLCAFNATEFLYGINFRFQLERVERRPNRRIKRGNGKIDVPYDVQEEVRISDVIAASSCFPGGFEPMRFPHDFCAPESKKLEELKEKDYFKDGIGLMDGGIYDNQGIDSIQISEKRRAHRYPDRTSPDHSGRLPYDLLIISDVSSPDINNPFKFHEAQDRKISHYSFNRVLAWIQSVGTMWVWLSIFLILTAMVMLIINGWQDNTITGVSVMLGGLGLVVLGIRYMLGNKLKFWSQEFKEFVNGSIDDFYLKKLSTLDFKSYSVKQLEPLVMDRVNSVSLMVQDLFLKQVRRLKYNSIYDDPLYKNKRIANLIKELTEDDWSKSNDFQDLGDIDELLKGDYHKVMGEKLPEIVNAASSFGTTLWFTDEDKVKDMLDSLIVTGQATMCFNLMVHVEQLRNSDDWSQLDLKEREEVLQVYDQCRADWKMLKKSPFHFLDNPDIGTTA